MSKGETVFTGVLALTGVATAAIFLVVSVARGFDPESAIAAFVALAATRYAIRS